MIRLDLVREDLVLLRDCLTHERSDCRRTNEPRLSAAARRWITDWIDRLTTFLESQPC